jgi:hypothetical protein
LLIIKPTSQNRTCKNTRKHQNKDHDKLHKKELNKTETTAKIILNFKEKREEQTMRITRTRIKHITIPRNSGDCNSKGKSKK